MNLQKYSFTFLSCLLLQTSPCNIIYAQSPGDIVINEVLAHPQTDANGDGIVNSSSDEFVEFVNVTASSLDVSGWKILSGSPTPALRHTIPNGTILPPFTSLVVFGGGTPADTIPGIVQTASSGALVLIDGGTQLTLEDGVGTIMESFNYPAAIANVSWARGPDYTGNFILHTSIGGFHYSPGRMNSDGSPLPVEIAWFSATVNGLCVELRWSTATEFNNYGFEVERRSVGEWNDNTTWSNVGFVQGNGTSNAPHEYSFTDQRLPFGGFAYRLKQVDNNGTFKYSKESEVSIEVPKVLALSQNYPNPFNPATTIIISIPKSLRVVLKIYDPLGREISTLINNEELTAGTYSKVWNAPSLPSGVYFYRLQAGSYAETKKLVLLK